MSSLFLIKDDRDRNLLRMEFMFRCPIIKFSGCFFFQNSEVAYVKRVVGQIYREIVSIIRECFMKVCYFFIFEKQRFLVIADNLFLIAVRN